MNLKQIRKSAGLTQAEASSMLRISLRSYKTYESDSSKQGTAKYEYLCETLSRRILVDESHGILTVDFIAKTVSEVCREHGIRYAYLFGSYSKGAAEEDSDVDLLVSDDVTGLAFFGLVEELRERLHKNVDCLSSAQLVGNRELLDEILLSGVRILG